MSLLRQTSWYQWIALGALIFYPMNSFAGLKDRARSLYWRIAHSAPSEAQLTSIESELQQVQNKSLSTEDRRQAMKRAVGVALSSKSFYSRSLVRLFTPGSNRAGDPLFELNDAVALQIGLVRDDADFREVLSTHKYYQGKSDLTVNRDSTGNPLRNPRVITAWSATDNRHYQELFQNDMDLSAVLEVTSQEKTTFSKKETPARTEATDSAGIITTRAFAQAYFDAGTNRRMFEYLLKNYLCSPLADIKDTTANDTYIRRDVDRQPSGDRTQFLSNCKGCHALQDPIAGAFVYFDFVNNALSYDPSKVTDKSTRNGTVFPGGHVPKDDSWRNFFQTSSSTLSAYRLGWRELDGVAFLQGKGAKSLGRALANTEAFSNCQAQHVFEHVCQRPAGIQDKLGLKTVVSRFESSSYRFKTLFEGVAELCL